jgi:hypothetical protein
VKITVKVAVKITVKVALKYYCKGCCKTRDALASEFSQKTFLLIIKLPA